MSENHVDGDRADPAYMKRLIADIEKRVEAVEKLREQRKVWVRPTPASESEGAASENGSEHTAKENGVGKELTIQFEVTHGTTEHGQNIYVTGSLRELGSLSPSGAVKLTTTSDTYPSWHGEAVVRDYNGEPIQLKFFKMTHDDVNSVEWDKHGEYIITPSENSVKQSVSWTS